MKTKTKQKDFAPVELTITIESERELKYLHNLIGCRSFNDFKNGKSFKLENNCDFLNDELFKAISKICKQKGLK